MKKMRFYIPLTVFFLWKIGVVEQVLFPYGPSAGDSSFVGEDDEAYFFPLTVPFVFYNSTYNQIYFSDNAVISFESFDGCCPGNESLPYIYPATILVFFSDFDGDTGVFHVRESQSVTDLAIAEAYVAELFPQLAGSSPNSIVVITWDSFEWYSGSAAFTNLIQGVLVTSTDYSVVLMIYGRITPDNKIVVIGVTNGDGIQFQELPESRTPAVLDLDTTAQVTTTGLYGFIVNYSPLETETSTELVRVSQNASVYCITSLSSIDLVDVTVRVISKIPFYLQALNTTAFQKGQRLEATENRCRTLMTSIQTNLSFTVNVSNSDHVRCGAVYANGFINLTIEAVEELGFYQGNDTVFQLRCNILPSRTNISLEVGDISSTTVASVTARSVYLRFQDRLNLEDSQALTSTDVVILGRKIFPTICFERGIPYNPDVDPYGVYAYSCQFANNQMFNNDGENETMDVIDSNGCLLRSSNKTGGQLHSFRELSKSSYPSFPFCITTGGFKAFRWSTGDKIFMKCKVDYCRNTQIYGESKCKDACRYTSIDTIKTDLDDSRKKRNDMTYQRGDEVSAVIKTINIDTASASSAHQDCVEKSFAKLVILSLTTSVVLASILTVALFYINSSQTKPTLLSQRRKTVLKEYNA